MRRFAAVLPVMISVAFLWSPAHAQWAFQKVYKDVGLDQKLDSQIPPELAFTDDEGKPVTLGSYFGSRPLVLSLVYYRCPMLCTQVLNGMVDGFKGIGFTPGKEFTALTVSIDPRETPALAAQKKGNYLQMYGRPDANGGWHFLTGDETSIRRLADAVGFRYLYDSTTGQFAHAAGIMVITPGGRVSRYLYGIEYAPSDLRLALVDASQEKIGSVVDKLLLLCYHYDPMTGKYGLVIANVFRIAGGLMVLLLAGGILYMLRRERRKGGGRQPREAIVQ